MLKNGTISIILTIYFGIIVTIDIISWIIYVLLLIFLIKCRIKNDRIISKEFFTLCIFNGILDIIFVIEEYINFRIPQFGFFDYFYINILSYSSIAGVCYTYSLCQVIVISLSGITLTCNRYYAIKFPTKYKEFWSGWRLFIFTIWPIGVVLPIFIIFCHSKVNFISDPSTGRLTQNFVDNDVNNSIWTTTILFHIFSLLTNGILNILLVKTIKKEFKNNRINMQNSSNSDNSIDLAMAKYAFMHFLFFGMIAVLETIIVAAFRYNFDSLAFNCLTLFVLAETIMVFFSPYALLVLSKDIRIRFFIFIGFNKLNNVFNYFSSNLQTSHEPPNISSRSNKTIITTKIQPQYRKLI
ncbi:7TM GPCR, serpentine receptor class v (Srv) family-containing protein [Strongyloides ratti]|uniref:7TM GPCR, serpentine receptor class v (Srv) family-containing protein n=1 Tax=Strongyloides ratti TaxID=34506 RepID=A0A090LIR2_STRRB|nr:7TM GPCR, serpentine receptor class v (Srv) family-containing protein [Strongyloides ratti]CEF69682.1 7TM GPCR, serpentine receptor class v (Srv) family-containing protein [Strongyloides ratti]